MSSTDTTKDAKPLSALSYSVGTDVGRRRDENQDSYGVVNTDNLKFYIVADGMGGAKGGATASSMAVKIVEQSLSHRDTLSPDDVARALSRANSDIFKMGSEEEGLSGMGTTFVGLAFFDKKMIVVNVGDSRAYRIRGDKVVKLTDDHTLVNDLLRNGAITEEQAENHPVAHMLTRSLGPCPDVDVDAFIVDDGPARKDQYLLCSDGLYNVVSEQEILAIVKNHSSDDAVQELISLANQRGGPDNITVIVIHLDESYPSKAEDFKESEYPRVVSKQLPKTDAIDIRATREQYRSGKYKRPHDDADMQIHSSATFKQNIPLRSEANALPQSPLVHLKWAGLMVLGLVMGFLLSETSSFFKHQSYTEIRTVLINPLATEIAKLPLVNYEFSDREMETGLFTVERIAGITEKQQFADSYPIKRGLSRNQIESANQRKTNVQEQLNKINLQLATLDNPKSVQVSERKENTTAEIRKLEAEQYKLSEELSTTSKNLVTWIERKQRLATVDPVDMASEVAFTSPYVRERKELFEKATWAYLREVEVWRFSPNDKELTQKISELGKAREQRRTELASVVAKAVDQSKEEIEESISELSAKTKAIDAKLSELQNDLEFYDLITGADSKSKQLYREDLIKRKELAQTELDELSRMLP